MVEALSSGESGARASIQPSKALCTLEKAPRTLYTDINHHVGTSKQILNPKSYAISTSIGLVLLYCTHPAVKNLTRRVKHVLNNIVDYTVSYGRGVV